MPYHEIQRQLIDKLREIGIYYAYSDRLSLFWLRNQFREAKDITDLIDELVRDRVSGNEPIHENGKYV